MVCPQCGAANLPTARFCSQCSAAVSGQGEVTAMPSAPQQESGGDSGASDAKPAPRTNMIARHWRGDYSLGVSYWVFGSILTLVVVALLSALGDVANLREFGPRASGATILLVYGFVAVFSIWQFVGIWRAATRHRERSGKAAWAAIAKVMIVLGLLRTVGVFISQGVPQMTEAGRLLAGIDNTPPYALHLLRDGKELELSGGMPFGTADAVRTLLDANPGVETLHLNSRGGRVNEAFMLYRLIEERGLMTYTSVECASACAIAFLAGRQRYLGENGRLGFHSVSIAGMGGDVANNLNGDVRQIFEKRGVPAGFIARATTTPPNDMWYPDADELLAAKVVDAVVDPRYFGLPGLTKPKDLQDMEAGLLAIPFYAALAQYDRETYAALRKILVEGLQKGRAQITIEKEIRARIAGELIPAYLKKAPDEPLLRYWRSQIAEMQHLARGNPQDCADFAYPQFAKTALRLQRLLPRAMLNEDLDALAEVVKGVATAPQPPDSGDVVKADLAEAVARAEERLPLTREVLQNAAQYQSDPALLCEAVTGLYGEILAIPDIHRAAAVLRYMQQP